MTTYVDTLELQITHSSQQTRHGDMTAEDWRTVITDAAELAIPRLRLTGGEPTGHPHWIAFTALALSLGLQVALHSDLIDIRPHWWEVLQRQGVSLATNYHSTRSREHDAITDRPGSYLRTRYAIHEAVRRRIPVRAQSATAPDEQHIAEARADLRTLGVTRIDVPSADESCEQRRAAVLPNGDVTYGGLSRTTPYGTVRERHLADIVAGVAPPSRE